MLEEKFIDKALETITVYLDKEGFLPPLSEWRELVFNPFLRKILKKALENQESYFKEETVNHLESLDTFHEFVQNPLNYVQHVEDVLKGEPKITLELIAKVRPLISKIKKPLSFEDLARKFVTMWDSPYDRVLNPMNRDRLASIVNVIVQIAENNPESYQEIFDNFKIFN